MNAFFSFDLFMVYIDIHIMYQELGTGEGSQASNPQSCSVRPQMVDGGRGLSDYYTESLTVDQCP
jgi:hypothetical protein